MVQPLVSVIITSRNEEKVVENVLLSVREQTYKHLEIIVVDNHSTDRTKAIARRYTSFVFNKGPERSVQRNFGAKKATGKFFLFLDADMELARAVIADCVTALTRKKNLGGVIIPEQSYGEGFWSKVKAYERSFYIGDETIEAARFFPRKVFFALGGFDEEITGPEDWDFSDRVRKHYCITRVLSYIRHNEKRLSLLGVAMKKYYYAKKTRAYFRKNKETIFSAKTVFFLRRSFYRNPKKILFHPLLFCGMILMFSAETIAGVVGVLVSHE